MDSPLGRSAGSGSVLPKWDRLALAELERRRDRAALGQRPVHQPVTIDVLDELAGQVRSLPTQTLREMWAACIPGDWPWCPEDVDEETWKELGRTPTSSRAWLVAVCRDELALRGEAA